MRRGRPLRRTASGFRVVHAPCFPPPCRAQQKYARNPSANREARLDGLRVRSSSTSSTHGSTWHSAGLVGQLRSSISLTRMTALNESGLYAELRQFDRQRPRLAPARRLGLASSQARLEEIRRQAAWAKTFGLPMEIVSAHEAQERLPADEHPRTIRN